MGRVRITRLFVLLALAALLAPRAEASRTSEWGSNPPASLVSAEMAQALASLAPAARLDTSALPDAVAAEQQPFNLGDVVLVECEIEHEEHFDLGSLTLVDLNLLRGPPPSYPETRVGGFELLAPFRVGASPRLSLWPRQACGFSCREVASDSRYDPWGLYGWGDFRKDVTDTAKSYYGFLSQAALEGNPVYQLYNTVNTAKALAGRTRSSTEREELPPSQTQRLQTLPRRFRSSTQSGTRPESWIRMKTKGRSKVADRSSGRRRQRRPTLLRSTESGRPRLCPSLQRQSCRRKGGASTGLRRREDRPGKSRSSSLVMSLRTSGLDPRSPSRTVKRLRPL